MSTNPHSPLTQDHLNQINQGLAKIASAEAQILMAKQAGIDVSQQEKSLEDSKTKLMNLKRVYFANS